MRHLVLSTLLLFPVTVGAVSPPTSDQVFPELPKVELAQAPEEGYLELDWEELIPEAERNIPLFTATPEIMVPEGSIEDMMPPQEEGGVRKELAGSAIQIPGFVVPLEGDAKTVTAFLLVPYFGACIHVPAPPTNQVIYVEFPQGVPVTILWDAILVSGSLSIQDSHFEMGSAGYSIKADYIAPYEEE